MVLVALFDLVLHYTRHLLRALGVCCSASLLGRFSRAVSRTMSVWKRAVLGQSPGSRQGGLIS